MFLKRDEPKTYNYNTIMKTSFTTVSAASAEHSTIIYSEDIFVLNQTQLCMNHSLQYISESHQSDSFFKSRTSSSCALFFRQSLRHHQNSELKAAQQCLQFTSVTLSSQLSDFKICWSQMIKQQILLLSESSYNKYDSITLWYNIIVQQYNIMTLLFKYDDSVSNTLTLSENSSQEDSEICFLSDQSWIIMKEIWFSYMHIYWLYHDYIVYNTLFTLLQHSAVDHPLTYWSLSTFE